VVVRLGFAAAFGFGTVTHGGYSAVASATAGCVVGGFAVGLFASATRFSIGGRGVVVVIMLIVVVVLVVIVMLVVVHFLSGRRRSHFGCRRQGLNDRSNRSFGNTGLLCHWCRGRARVGSRGGLGGGQRTFFHAGHKGSHQLRQVRRGLGHNRRRGRCRHNRSHLGHSHRGSHGLGRHGRFGLVGGVCLVDGFGKGWCLIFGEEAGHVSAVNGIDQG
jgi:hypothetical protein